MPLVLQCSEVKVAKTLADAIDQSNGTLGGRDNRRDPGDSRGRPSEGLAARGLRAVRYVLDANIAIAAMNGVAAVRDRLARIGAADVGGPLVAIAELVFGAYRSRRREENLARVAALRQTVHVRPVTVPAVPSTGAVARAHRWGHPCSAITLRLS